MDETGMQKAKPTPGTATHIAIVVTRQPGQACYCDVRSWAVCSRGNSEWIHPGENPVKRVIKFLNTCCCILCPQIRTAIGEAY